VAVKTIFLFVEKVFDFINSVLKDTKITKQVFPLVATFFVFIILANLLALLPGFLGSVYLDNGMEKYSILRSPNSDLTITLALSIISVFSIQYFSFKILGSKKFLKRFFNFSSPSGFVMGFFEILSESVKILSFSFRLFGNVFAGEVLLLVMAFLLPYFIPVPFQILEVFVGFIQALIFAILTITFIKSASLKEDK